MEVGDDKILRRLSPTKPPFVVYIFNFYLLIKLVILAPMKQSGDIRMTGTFDISDITLYRMNGEFYARSKSTLTGKRFRKDKAFEGSRRSNERFKRGNELASQVYQAMPEEKRFYKLYCRLKREAILYLKCGKTEEQVVKELEIICANPETLTCHLNLSLPATARPVLYRDWYKQEEKVYQYNYDNQMPIKRRQRVLYFEGSEDFPLNVSAKDIWDISEGTEEDMLNMKRRMEERLAKKKRRKAIRKKEDKKAAAASKAARVIVFPVFKKSVIKLPRFTEHHVERGIRINNRKRVQRHAFFRQGSRGRTLDASLTPAES